jgi:hypothetical protein
MAGFGTLERFAFCPIRREGESCSVESGAMKQHLMLSYSLAAVLCAAFPISAQAGKSGGGGQHSGSTATSGGVKSGQASAAKKGSTTTTKKTKEPYLRYDLHDGTVSSYK